MRCNKTRKYMAVFLCLLMVLGVGTPDRAWARSVDRKPEIREVNAVLPAGGLQETRIYRVDDGEAENVPSLDMSRRMERSTTRQTVFEKGIGDYGYKSLTGDQQSFYDKISVSLTVFESGATNGEYTQITMEEEISYVPFQCSFDDMGLDEDQASQVWIAFAADHPGLFWLENGCAITSNSLMPIVRKDYWGDAATATGKREDMKAKIEKGAKEYLNVASYYSLAYDKVREMDEMIIQAVDFAYKSDGMTPEEAGWAHTIEGVFGGEHNAVVSEGYAKAFAFLLNNLNIPNVYVTGKRAGTAESHVWNCVSFDNGNTYYCMDLAWDDMGADDKRTGNSYNYFAMPESKFGQKHEANTPGGTDGNWLYTLPELGDDMDFTYFKQYGAYGTTSECSDYDKTEEFLSRVKALAPNRLSTYAVMVDTVTLSYIRDVMNLSSMLIITSDEYDMRIWADPLTDYSKGSSALHNLSARNMTIDLGSETEKTLSLTNVSNANGNYVRWHSENNEVAVVKAPAYTKMEDGASVQIVAKKAGTAVIRAEGSNSGTMTCTVEVTGELPVATPTPEPTGAPELTPTPEGTGTPELTPTPEPTGTPEGTMTPEGTGTPESTPTPEGTMTPEETLTPEETMTPEGTLTPEPTGTPEGTMTPEGTGTPELTPTPEPTGTPEGTMTPEGTGTPESTPTPEGTMTPEETLTPEETMTPEGTLTPEPTVTPEGTMTPEGTGTPEPTPTPASTLPPTPTAKPSGTSTAWPTQEPVETGKPAETATPSTTTKPYDRDLSVKVKRLILTVKSMTVKAGDTYQINAVILPPNATDKRLTYKSSDESVATVSASGKVRALKAGKVTITVTAADGKTEQMHLTVEKKPASAQRVTVTEKSVTIGIGEKIKLETVVYPKDASNKKLTYRATNNKVKVSKTGRVTARKPGKCKIIISLTNGEKVVVRVTVKKKPDKLSLNAYRKTLKVGKKFVIKPRLPKGTASHKIKFVSGRKKVATVSKSGKVTAKKKGTAVIVVKTYNGIRAVLKIRVK